jgi:periplasmic divalent cation tolerance protein
VDEQVVLVTSTFDDEAAALDLADGVVRSRLAACAQVEGPITSVYRWDGQVQREHEWRLVCKTRATLADALTQKIQREHSYAVPEVVITPILGGNPEYLGWVVDETRSPSAEAPDGTRP